MQKDSAQAKILLKVVGGLLFWLTLYVSNALVTLVATEKNCFQKPFKTIKAVRFIWQQVPDCRASIIKKSRRGVPFSRAPNMLNVPKSGKTTWPVMKVERNMALQSICLASAASEELPPPPGETNDHGRKRQKEISAPTAESVAWSYLYWRRADRQGHVYSIKLAG